MVKSDKESAIYAKISVCDYNSFLVFKTENRLNKKLSLNLTVLLKYNGVLDHIGNEYINLNSNEDYTGNCSNTLSRLTFPINTPQAVEQVQI